MKEAAQQFAATAENYLLSEFHIKGPDLKAMVTLAQPTADDAVLDIGTNVGHLLRELAGSVRFAAGVDVAHEPLALSRKVTDARNVSFVEAEASALPFADGAFDIITCRLAGHHFLEITRSYAEMARVLDREGVLVLSDFFAPPNAEFAEWLNKAERLRDPSHVEDRMADDELRLLREAGLTAELVETFRIRFGLDGWLRRAGTPADRAERVREMFANAEPRFREAFAYDAESQSFVIEVGVIVAGWS